MLGRDIDWALPDLRAEAEGLFDSTIQFFVPGEDVTDPSTGEVTRANTVVWSGPCAIRPAGDRSQETEFGGAEVFVYDYLVKIPWSVTTVVEHLRGTVTSCPDLALAGITMEVQKVARGSRITTRRLACTVVV